MTEKVDDQIEDKEEILVEMDEDAGKSDDIQVLEAEPKKKTEIPVELGIEELKAQLTQAQTDKEAATRSHEVERNARIKAERDAQQARGDIDQTNMQLLDAALLAKKQESKNLKAEYRDALQGGDYETAADVQERMSMAAAEILQLENGKLALKNRPPSPRAESDDRFEQFVSQLSPRSADWVRRNPEYVTDEKKYLKMVAAHHNAVADGFIVDSDAYFAALEGTLKTPAPRPAAQEQANDASSEAAKPFGGRQIESAPPAAPPARSSPNGSSSSPRTIRLSAAEREMAEMMGMTVQEYGRNKLTLQKEGKLSN